MTFIEMLRERWDKVNSMVCVGLDSDYSQIPEVAFGGASSIFHRMRNFNHAIVLNTNDFVCAYKPNAAFYEGKGEEGWKVLADTCGFIRTMSPGIPIILDAKRTDIGNTNKGYAEMAFGPFCSLEADAITVNPYFGGEALKPFLDRADKGVIVLCRTSNPGAKDFQDQMIPVDDYYLPGEVADFFRNLKTQGQGRTIIRMYEYVAYRAAYEWNKNGNVLLVVGATWAEELRNVRQIVGDNMPILVPGIGAQKGDLEATVKAGLDSTGFGMIINSSRGIIFASKEGDFAEAAGREAKKLRDQINKIKAQISGTA